jgi:hypothetical protein
MAMLLSDLLSDHPGVDPTHTRIAYFTQDHRGAWVQAGRWPQEYGAHGVVLWIDARSVCFGAAGVRACALKAVQVDMPGGGEKERVVEVGGLLVVHHRADERADILLASFRGARDGC